jgi:hypothetical protein
LARLCLDDDSERTRNLVLDGWTMLPFTSVTTAPQLVADVSRVLHKMSA